MIDNFEDAVEVVRTHSFYGNNFSDEVMEAVAAIRMYWDQEKVDKINAAAPSEARPLDGDMLFIFYRVVPAQWQVIHKNFVPEVLTDEHGNLS